ncbi:MAG: ribonuclease H-like domain-containing protein [Patescibacteria group bacterium]
MSNRPALKNRIAPFDKSGNFSDNKRYMKKIVIDIETKDTFQEAQSQDPAALHLSLLVVYEYASDAYASFLEQDLPKLWPILENADSIIGFNLDHFDMPILNKYYPGDLTKKKTLDLLGEIKKASGRRISLNSVAAATLGTAKSGSGLDAIRWWRRGEIEKVRQYCQDDVRITKELYDFALRNGYVQFEQYGAMRKVVLDTSRWELLPPGSNNQSLF